MSGGRNNTPPELLNDVSDILDELEQLDANTEDVEDILNDVVSELQDIELDVEDVDLNTDEVEDKLDTTISELQDIDANTDTVESELQDVNTELDTIQTNTDQLEPLLNDIISELQDVETDVEAVESLLDELEDALASVGQDQIRVDIIDEGDVATEATLSSVNDFLDAIEDALESTGTDELRVNTEPSEPITVDNFAEFEVDSDNSIETPLAANEEFVGDFKAWDQNVGIAIALVADVAGGVDTDGEDALQIELSGDGVNVGRTINIDYPPESQVGEGIQPIIAREAEFYRVRYQNGAQDQNTFRLNTIELPRQLQEQLRPIGDTVNNRTVANTVKSVISAQEPDGEYTNVGANRVGDLRTTIDQVGNNAYRYAPRGDVSLYGEQKVGSKVPQIEIQWWEEEDPEVTLDNTITTTGSGVTTNSDGYATFSSGTDPNGAFVGETFTTIDYLTSSEIKASFSAAWIQPPTSEGDYSMLGLSDGRNGFEIGYKGTTFGVRRLRSGTEVDFIPQSDFNGDKLDGNPESEYELQDEPVAINHQTYDMWRIRYGWYGVAPTHIEVLAPDGHWVFVHKFSFTDETLPQTEQPDLPIRTFVKKNNSDSTDIIQRVSAFFGGVIANVQLAQQPDGDYVSEKATGQAFIERELLTANEEFVSEWVDTDGWGAIGVSINADQPSAEDGLKVEYTSDVQRVSPEIEDTASFTFSQSDIEGEQSLYVVLPTQLDGYRVRYKNGATGQNEFNLNVTQFKETRTRQTNLNTDVSNDAVVGTNRSILFAQTDADQGGDIEKIRKSEPGEDGGLRTAISEHETDTPIRPDNIFDVDQVDVPDLDGGGPVNILNGGLSGRTKLKITNDGSQPVFIGPDDTVTATTGYQIDPDVEREFPFGEGTSVWAVAEDATGGSTTTRLDAATAETSGTATNPDNAVTSDDARAIYDADQEFVDAAGYDASAAQTRDEVSTVHIGFEGRRDTVGLQTITYEETASAIQTGGTSITTDTTLTGDQSSVYIATVSVRSDSVGVSSVTGFGLTWTQEAVAIQTGVRTEVWVGVGDATADDTVTANFDDTCNSAAIGASRVTGVDQTNPVQSPGDNAQTSQNWTVAPTPNSDGDFIVGGAGLVAQSTNTPSTDDTERVDRNIGGSNAERLTIAIHSDSVTSTDEEIAGTWGTNNSWAGAAVALNQAEFEDPEYLIEYEVGTEGIGDTTGSGLVGNTSDTDFETDVSADRSWTYTDIDNTAVTVTYFDSGTADLEVDHIYIEFTEVDTGSTQRISLMESGRTGGV